MAGLGVFAVLGQPASDPNDDNYDDEVLPLQFAYRARDRVTNFYKFFNEPLRAVLIPQDPNFPPMPYVLVIEPDKVLYKYEWTPEMGWRLKVRKGAREFLRFLGANFYEVVLFTDMPSMTSAPIFEKIDEYGCAINRFSREATIVKDGVRVKDISGFDRPEKRIVILDTDPRRYSNNPDNGLFVEEWDGDSNDTGLIDLVKFFQALATSGIDDVRVVTKYYDGKDVVETFRANQKAAEEHERLERERALAEAQQNKSSGWGFFSKPAAPAAGPDQADDELKQQVLAEEKLLREQREAEAAAAKLKAEEEAKNKPWYSTIFG
ncbi:hypothetical protein SARC_12025 [Sphaeroforma arctica JP610]|uniref:Mitochondrial import inner membrane translocase subunit TIM50 n=1 Tax=Sphaeroforma arctica JP610 TaxID=667725 RepID=A0A0L0FF97_9EUKA|nr:hypothetical protein SARC_12025 [Sphaeroforma arctica JP610]KNC75449.1 hypothetical protein SARC_12025 [Sphaeroforma arctica JP610]|eukprot:XP_014149351.1 hypothetical protein SARC_12025 [Sphaeroforma arctica JP610]